MEIEPIGENSQWLFEESLLGRVWSACAKTSRVGRVLSKCEYFAGEGNELEYAALCYFASHGEMFGSYTLLSLTCCRKAANVGMGIIMLLFEQQSRGQRHFTTPNGPLY